METVNYETLTKHNTVEVPEQLRLNDYSKYDVLALAFYFAQESNFDWSKTMKDYADIMHESERENGSVKDISYELLCRSFVDVYCFNKVKSRVNMV